MEEMRKDIVSVDPLYEISTTGLIRNKASRKLLYIGVSSSGYPCVFLEKRGKKTFFFLHRLLLQTFVSPCPPGMVCRHLDGNQLNFSLKNLKWGTHSENRRDMIEQRKLQNFGFTYSI